MTKQALGVMKILFISYLITVLLLLLLTIGLYKMNLTDVQVTVAVMIIYGISCFAGGFLLAGKRNKKIFRGIGFGLIYFAILTAVALIIGNESAKNISELSKSAIVCVLSGILGAYFSPI